MTLHMPTNGEREYLRAFGIVALFVAASSTRVPCLIGYARNLNTALESIRGRWHWSIELTHAWWLRRPSDAGLIIDGVNAVYPRDKRGLFEVEADTIALRMCREASRIPVNLTPHDDAVRRVQQALARVDGVISAANAAGQLRWFNRAYRTWRTARPPEVAAAFPYALARSRLRAAVVRRIARDETPLAPDLLSEIFPGGIEGGRGADPLALVSTTSDSPDQAERIGGAPNGNGSMR